MLHHKIGTCGDLLMQHSIFCCVFCTVHPRQCACIFIMSDVIQFLYWLCWNQVVRVEVNGTSSGSCPFAGFIMSVEPSGLLPFGPSCSLWHHCIIRNIVRTCSVSKHLMIELFGPSVSPHCLLLCLHFIRKQFQLFYCFQANHFGGD
jgi:hypothetical protein